MAVKKGGLGKGLGKGLDALISNQYTENEPGMNEKKEENISNNGQDNNSVASGGPFMVKIRKVEPSKSQPRTNFDEDSLKELSESIKEHGMIQPIVVKHEGDSYKIIAGERRWRAAKLAGMKEVPILIRECSEQEQAELSLIENLQREDLNPIEEAKAYQSLINKYHLKQDEIAEKVFKSRTVVTNALRLLKLDESVQQMLIDGVISTGHAKVLLALDNSEDQKAAAERIVDDNLSVRETERLIKSMHSNKETVVKPALTNSALYETIVNKMKSRVGTMVRIKRKAENAGKIEIEYYSADDLERIMEKMGINE